MINKIIFNKESPEHYQNLKIKDLETERETEKPFFLLDLTVMETSKKCAHLEDLIERYPKAIIATEVTVNSAYILRQRFQKRIYAFLGGAFYSPKQSLEIFFPAGMKKDFGQAFFYTHLKMSVVPIEFFQTGFHFPRILATLLNEANFLLQERLCDEKDLDQAVKLGLNYPLGLSEWQKKIDISTLQMLLEALFSDTKNPRYGSSFSLHQ